MAGFRLAPRYATRINLSKALAGETGMAKRLACQDDASAHRLM